MKLIQQGADTLYAVFSVLTFLIRNKLYKAVQCKCCADSKLHMFRFHLQSITDVFDRRRDVCGLGYGGGGGGLLNICFGQTAVTLLLAEVLA